MVGHPAGDFSAETRGWDFKIAIREPDGENFTDTSGATSADIGSLECSVAEVFNLRMMDMGMEEWGEWGAVFSARPIC